MNHYVAFMINGHAIRIDTETNLEVSEGTIIYTDESGNTHHISRHNVVDLVRITEENYQIAIQAEAQAQAQVEPQQ